MFEVYHNFFNTNECDQLYQDILKLRQHFIPRSPSLSYFGGNFFDHLSKNNYDPVSAVPGYEKGKDLEIYRGYWHDLLVEKLKAIGKPNPQYTHYFSRPGFQFVEDQYPGPGIWHYNSEKIVFPYSKEFPDYDNSFNTYFDAVYTFTIMLTKGDFTFDYYPETVGTWKNDFWEDLKDIPCQQHHHVNSDVCPDPNCTLNKYETVHYQQGTMLLQTSKFLHRIGPSNFTGTHRLTMQGQALLKDNKFYLYW